MNLRKRTQAWLTLTAFIVAVILTEVYWYNFSPIMSFLVSRYRVSEMLAGWTIMVFPLTGLLLSVHSGAVIDRRGYRFSVMLGLLWMTVSSVLRLFDHSFWLLLAGQTGISIGVPYIVTGISNVVTDWFEPEEEATMTGLCTMALGVGIGFAFVATPWMIGWFGFHSTMMFGTVLVVLSTAFFWVVGKENPEKPRVLRSHKVAWRVLFSNRNLIILYLGGFIAQGCGNALQTWMEILWHQRGFPLEATGMANGLMIVGGTSGCLLITPLADRFQNHRLIFFLCLLPGPFLLNPFIWAQGVGQGYTFGTLTGLFAAPALAISLTLLERSAGKGNAGAASGMFWTIGNLGVLIVCIGFELLKEATNWSVSIDVLLVLLALSVLIVLLMNDPEPHALPELTASPETDASSAA
jgi:FLVCR family feline leukemia virus subgroup C receptor-related protein